MMSPEEDRSRPEGAASEQAGNLTDTIADHSGIEARLHLARDPLTPDERNALAVCEAIVEEGLPIFVNVANALLEIHSRRLYRESHSTFQRYMAERFGVSQSHAYRLVIAARVQTSPIGDKITSVSQAQIIGDLVDDPDTLRAIVERATELRGGKRLTAAALRQARAELLAPDEAPVLRAVYEAAEIGEAVWRAALTRLVEGLAKVPSNLWRELSAQVNPQAPDAFLRSCMHRIMCDAEMTPEAVAIVRRIAAVLDEPPTEILSRMVEAVGVMRGTFGTLEGLALEQGDPGVVSAMREAQDGMVPVSRAFADHLATATIALRTVDPAPLPADAEGDEADQWRARIAKTRGVPLPPAEEGPTYRAALELARGVRPLLEALRGLDRSPAKEIASKSDTEGMPQ